MPQQALDLLIQMGLPMLAGFLFSKLGWIQEKAREGLARIVVYVVLPLSLVSALPLGGHGIAHIGLLYLGGAAALMGVLLAVSLAVSRIGRLSGEETRVQIALGMFGMTFFPGAMVLKDILGEGALPLISAYLLLEQILLWSLGYMLIAGGKKGAAYPLSAAFGIVFALPQVFGMLPENAQWISLARQGLGRVGDTLPALSALYLGAAAAQIPLGQVLRRGALYAGLLLFSFALPLLAGAAAEASGLFSRTQIGLFTFLPALPASALVPMLADVSGTDRTYATGYAFFSNLLFLGAWPGIAFVLKQILGGF